METKICDELKKDNYEFDINNYIDKEVLYLIKVKDNIYKYGITYDILRRFTIHKSELEYEKVIKCWVICNRTVLNSIERAIENYLALENLNCIYRKKTEIFRTTDNITIEHMINKFEWYKKKYELEYEKKNAENILDKKIVLIKELNLLVDKLKDSKQDLSIINKIIDINDLNNECNIKKDTIKLDKIINDEKQIIQEESSDKIVGTRMRNIQITDDNLKRCTRCQRIKEIKNFDLDKRTNELYKYCIDCRKKANNYSAVIKNEIIEDDTHIKCTSCCYVKEILEYDLNPKNNKLYKHCKKCRDVSVNYTNKFKKEIPDVTNIL